MIVNRAVGRWEREAAALPASHDGPNLYCWAYVSFRHTTTAAVTEEDELFDLSWGTPAPDRGPSVGRMRHDQ
jgi:hypothetical protein